MSQGRLLQARRSFKTINMKLNKPKNLCSKIDFCKANTHMGRLLSAWDDLNLPPSKTDKTDKTDKTYKTNRYPEALTPFRSISGFAMGSIVHNKPSSPNYYSFPTFESSTATGRILMNIGNIGQEEFTIYVSMDMWASGHVQGYLLPTKANTCHWNRGNLVVRSTRWSNICISKAWMLLTKETG